MLAKSLIAGVRQRSLIVIAPKHRAAAFYIAENRQTGFKSIIASALVILCYENI